MAHMALRFSHPRKEGGQAGGGAARRSETLLHPKPSLVRISQKQKKDPFWVLKL